MATEIQADIAVLGSGPGGYAAAFRAADLGKKVVLVERYPSIGGVCLNVGCIPSKALLHIAKVIDEAADFAHHGVEFAAPTIDMDKVRGWKDSVVKKLTGGLQMMAKQRKVEVVTGFAKFADVNTLSVDNNGELSTVKFNQCIIAAGSESVKLPFIPEDPRVMDSTGALELEQPEGELLILGGGIIGLEMATVYRALGSTISVVEMQDQLVPGADADLIKVYHKRLESRYDNIMLKTSVTKVEAKDDGLWVTFEGEQAPETNPKRFDRILVAVGRRPNGKALEADKAGVNVDERGFIAVDSQLRTNISHIFAIGDIIGQPMLAHKASHEGHIAAEVACGLNHKMDAKCIPSVAYTDPEIAWVGVTEHEANAQGIAYEKAVFPWMASGRALAVGRSEGFTKVLFDSDGRIIGGAIIGVNAGDIIGELCLAIEMGCDAEDLGLTIHPHPTFSESVMLAAEVYAGTITDMPNMAKKKA